MAQSFVSSRAAVLHRVTEDYIVMTWDRCMGVVFKGQTTLAGVQEVANVYHEHSMKFPSGVYLLTIVEPAAPLPSAEAREALAVFLRSGAGRTRMSAVVHEGSGFRAAAVRSVVTGLAMLVKLPYPHQIFATVEQAAKWMSSTRQRDFDPDYAVIAVQHARRDAVERPVYARGR